MQALFTRGQISNIQVILFILKSSNQRWEKEIELGLTMLVLLKWRKCHPWFSCECHWNQANKGTAPSRMELLLLQKHQYYYYFILLWLNCIWYEDFLSFFVSYICVMNKLRVMYWRTTCLSPMTVQISVLQCSMKIEHKPCPVQNFKQSKFAWALIFQEPWL